MVCRAFTFALALISSIFAAALRGAEPASPLSFDHDIQPLFGRCVVCHGPGQAKGGLRLDQRATAEQPPALVGQGDDLPGHLTSTTGQDLTG